MPAGSTCRRTGCPSRPAASTISPRCCGRRRSAASSSGEEPYTLAIQVHRTLGVRLADWAVEILGTDISEKVLEQAMTGKYPAYSVRNLQPTVMKRYFKETAGIFQIDPTIQSMVRFEKLNLKDSLAARRFGTFDVIFCRNVMIYFDRPTQRSILEKMMPLLAPEGLFFAGHSENLLHTNDLMRSLGQTVYARAKK